MKKTISTLFLVITLSLIVTGCGSDSSGGDGQVELSLFATMSNEGEKLALREIIEDFEVEYPNISIEENLPGDGYEDLIRVKMGANDMPDLFDTHGWATSRYAEYVADLQDMEWVENLDPAFESILKDESGKVYAFPMNQAKDGLSYNVAVLEEYGIEPPTTFDDFMAALEKIKEESNGEVTPLWIGGGDSSAFGQLFDQFATPLLVTDNENNYEDELLDGTFDWTNYTILPEKLKEMQDNGLLNVDVLTASNSQAVELMAQRKIGFTIVGGSLGPEVAEVAPDEKVGVIPMPTFYDGDKPSWIGGERFTLAASKDSEYLEESKLFIEFMSRSENAKKIAEGTSYPTALTNVVADNYYSEYYDSFEDVPVEPYFDRVYLPSGMWDILGSTAQEVVAGTMTPEEVSEKMESEYHRLRGE